MRNLYKIFLASIAILFMLGFGAASLAQTDAPDATDKVSTQNLGVSNPSLLPNSPFYFLKEWKRQIHSFFTFDYLKKAELQQQFANERLLELQKLVDEGKVSQDVLNKATKKYNQTMDKIKKASDKIKNNTENNEDVNKFLEKFANQQILREKILQRLQNQVPEEVKQNIEQAREKHLKRFGEVMEKLEANKEMFAERIQNAPENASEQNGEVREKIQQNIPEDVRRKLNKMKRRINENTNNKGIACTMDAKQCPDGSYVGRIGPNCEFAECPRTTNDCRNLWWFDDKETTCQQKQFCGAYMYRSLRTFEEKADCERALLKKNETKNSSNANP